MYVESGVLVCVVCAKRVTEKDLGEINHSKIQVCKACLRPRVKTGK